MNLKVEPNVFIINKIATSKLPPSLNGDRIASCIQPHLPYLNSENLNITTYTTHFKPEAEHNFSFSTQAIFLELTHKLSVVQL
jgi:hypothetical protein